MEITKRIKAIPKEIDLLMDTSQIIDLRYAKRDGREVINDFEYENEKFNFKCVFRIPEELEEEVKKARGFKQIWALYKKHNKEAITEYVERKTNQLQKKIKELKELVN